MSRKHFDVIVLGVGSMGAAACYYLAQRGKRVLGLEQFDIPHDLGSHAGQSRIIRKAYFEHPGYVPLLEKSYANWKQIEQAAGTTLYHRTGLLYAGLPESPLVTGTRRSAAQYQIELECITGQQKKRFPQFEFPPEFEVLFEPDAGFITPERAISAFAYLALQRGATLLTRCKAGRWDVGGDAVEVQTDRSHFTSDALVIAAGAWTAQLLPALGIQLTVTRQVATWFRPRVWNQFLMGAMPCWLIAPPELPGVFYGFPMLPPQHFGGPPGLKAAYHYPGPAADPDRVNRTHTPEEEKQVADAIDRFLPNGRDYTLAAKTCLYTNTPDENFVIDFLPDTQKRVVVAAGFSGHGFKFAAGLGEVLADMAVNQSTAETIAFLSLRRFG
jgi:sarcosine oxidase